MRADRLVAALLVLQSRGRVTAAELAEELEVSVKTARRDLEALMMAGIPVYSQAGKHGGWSLVGDARTDLSGLTAAEARTLFLLAGPSSHVTPQARSALRKLVQALPETFRAEAEAAASAIRLDPAKWGTTAWGPPPHLDVLQQAVIDGVQVRIGYIDRTRTPSERVVHPLGLVEKGTVWYLIAGTESGMRTFRVGRIREVVLTDDPVERPPDFDLNATWQSVAANIEELRTSFRARVLIDVRAVGALRGQFGSAVTVLDERRDDGRAEVEIGSSSAHLIAQQLAGWGNGIEVLEPDAVRDELARIGTELVAAYRP
ncbi:MAG: YafY family transcriptional regulator [Actinomycetota bacterium]|nr:YafY family transcriptional regulator [Actinomycetota bacterium]